MEAIVKEIEELRRQRYSCSQATVVGLARTVEAEMPDERLLKAAVAGLRGGIGRTFDDGTCGALTGAVVALGFMFPDDPEKAATLAKELYNGFKNEFGTVCCGRITDENGRKRCTECCVKAGTLAAALYRREVGQ